MFTDINTAIEKICDFDNDYAFISEAIKEVKLFDYSGKQAYSTISEDEDEDVIIDMEHVLWASVDRRGIMFETSNLVVFSHVVHHYGTHYNGAFKVFTMFTVHTGSIMAHARIERV